MSIVDDVAQLIDADGLGTYTPAAAGGDVFLYDLPDSPDSAVAVQTYTGGAEPNAKFGWDTVAIQLLVRGPAADARVASTRAQGLYDHFVGLSRRDLASGDHLFTCTGVQSSPVWLRRDEQRRPLIVINLRADIERANVPNRQ